MSTTDGGTADVVRLDCLPAEIIALIATHSDASTILKLSETSHAIRAAVYDASVFRSLLTLNQSVLWDTRAMDLEALATRAASDTRSWARFAVADQRAWKLHTRGKPTFVVPHEVEQWLPEIAMLRHPLFQLSCWSDFLDYTNNLRASYVFTRVLNLLFIINTGQDCDVHLSALVGKLQRREKRYLDCADTSTMTFFWSLRDNIVGLYSRLKTRRAVWPYNTHALVPDISLPSIHALPLLPIADVPTPYALPVPFAEQCETSRTESWSAWYAAHCLALADSPDFLWEGEWQGYYSVADGFPDPPMVGIRFRNRAEENAENKQRIEADQCQDGVGQFSLSGWVQRGHHPGEVVLSMRKQYVVGPLWQWDCRVTPFGIVGFWGLYSSSTMFEKLERHGSVWLWKKDWAMQT